MTTAVASRPCSSSSASASRQYNKGNTTKNNTHNHKNGRASPATFGGDATKEIYGYAFLGLSFLLVSLLYLGHDALFYSDPTDDVRKQPASSAATTSETTGTSTTDNMSSSDNGFVYRRVDSGQSDAQVLRYIMERSGGHVHVDLPDKQDTSVSISMEEGMTILSQDASESIQMARDISALISNSSFDGVFFEMPGVDSATVSTTPFEFVLVNAPSLAQFAESHPDRYAFEEHLDKCEERQTCCAFNNLGGDARLIAPRMMVDHGQEDSRVYSHLASFVRGADEGQIVDMWQLSASEYLRTVRGRGPTKGKRTWFSTSGMGVAWLHVRIDSYSKYYQYGPFKG